MLQRKLMIVLAALLSAITIVMVIQAASNATITFGGDADEPDYSIVATDLVDDDSGCDYVTMVMTDANGLITDIDQFCLDALTGMGDDETDWWSYEGATDDPALGPITYSLFDTGLNDACDDDENSIACGDYVLSGAVACIAESYFQPASLPAGTAYKLQACNPAPTTQEPVPEVLPTSAACTLVVPLGSVVGDAPFSTQVYYEPGKASPGVMLNPGTYIVLGQDESESFYKIMLACQFVWVEKAAMQPSFQAPQNGAPLPTTIVGAGDVAGTGTSSTSKPEGDS